MDEIKEIEERWDYPNADKLDWNNAKDDIGRLLSKIKEFDDAIAKAQEENPDEIHCTCVPLLKIRIKELEKELAKIKSDPSIGKIEIQDWPESPEY